MHTFIKSLIRRMKRHLADVLLDHDLAHVCTSVLFLVTLPADWQLVVRFS